MARVPPTKKRGIVAKAIGEVVGRLNEGKGLPLLAGGRTERRREVASGVAAELGLALYTVDLSYVVNTYIGETEKSLADVFALAEAGNALLFFDEAEALFGKASEMKALHHRQAKDVAAFLKKRLGRYKGRVLVGSGVPEKIGAEFLGKPVEAVVVGGRRPAAPSPPKAGRAGGGT